jgi:hypothetical protein
MLIDRAWAAAFAEEWAQAWNSGDLDRILNHYADDFEMASPLMRERMGVESGRLKGKAAIGAYWAIGLSAKPPLRFEILDVLAGIDVMGIYYLNVTRRLRVLERLRFNADGLVVEAEALWGEAVT